MQKLTPKQQRFVDEYLIDLNATQAAIRSGYSAKTCEQQGPRLLGNVGVARAIGERQKIRHSAAIMSAEEVQERLTRIARGDHTAKGYNMFGEPYEKEPSMKEQTVALELLGKRHALFTDRVLAEVTQVPQIIDDIGGDGRAPE